jgi:hypothetical protein
MSDLERRRELGQFFTPPVVAGFVWDMLEIIHGARLPRRARVIDPACGEGVFLRVAAERGAIAPAGLFGVDIDETLAPAWRRDPPLKEAHLLVDNGLLDRPDHGLLAGTFDRVVGNPPFAGRGVRDLLRLLEGTEGAENMPATDLFGALVLNERPAPPGPPLTLRERGELDQLARALVRFQCWRLRKEGWENGEALPNDPDTGDLFAGQAREPFSRNGANELDQAAALLAAWPPGRPLDPKRPETRLVLRRLAGTAIEVFFMERFVRLARPGGLIAVIVPESILASDQLGLLRTWLLTEMDLLAVVGLPQQVFAGVGAKARTSIVFARRRVRPRGATDRPAAPPDDEPGSVADNGTGPRVLMAASNPESPGFGLERYLADVLEHARGHAGCFPTEPT